MLAYIEQLRMSAESSSESSSSASSSEWSSESPSPPSLKKAEPESSAKRKLSDNLKMGTPAQREARRQRMLEEARVAEINDPNWDTSRRADGSRRKMMTHDELIQASYGHHIPHFQKNFVMETDPPTMHKLAKRIRRSIELRETIGPVYETSAPCNSTAPLFFDFGSCPWMLDVKDMPKLDPVKENQRFIEKMERIKSQQQHEQQIAERVAYGQQLLAAVMTKAENHRGGLTEYLAQLPQAEQLHIIQTIQFNQQQQEKQEKAKIGIANPKR